MPSLLERCESPIEERMCKILIERCELPAVEEDYSSAWKRPPVVRQPKAFLFGQQSINRYRVDFLIVVIDRLGEIPIAIECDGREFHNRDDQTDRDRARDDRLRDAGCKAVVRFTGRDITRHPEIIANDVLTILAAVGVPLPSTREEIVWLTP